MKSIQEILLPEHPALRVRCWTQCGNIKTAAQYSHWHDFMEIVYNRKGVGIQQVNQTFYTLRANQMSVICPNQLHSFAASFAVNELELQVLQFDLPFLLGQLKYQDGFCDEWLSEHFFFPEAVTVTPKIKILMEEIQSEMDHQCVGYVQAVTGLLYELLVILYRANPVRLTSAEQKASMVRNRMLLAKTFRFINECYMDEHISIECAAKEANLSVTHFCRIFKLSTGMDFHEYLTRYRVLIAEQMFDTEKSLTEIAFSSGFENLSTFSRAFKKYRGAAPGKLRNKKDGNEQDTEPVKTE